MNTPKILRRMSAVCMGSALLTPLTTMAAVTPVAQYHLGETGSLGTNSRPQDSVGTYHYTGNNYSGATPTATAGVYAPGSTTYLDTSNTTRQEGFWGPTFPVSDNFAFGIFVRAAENTATTRGNVFALGAPNVYGCYKITLETGGWAASSHNVAWIGPDGGTGFVANQWVHVAVIRSGGVSKMYLNGVPQSGSSASAPVTGQSHLNVDAGGLTAFDGQIDEARVVTFDAGEPVDSILNALTNGSQNHFERDSVKTINKAALGAGLTSVYRPNVDLTTVVDAEGFSVASGHVLQIEASPGLVTGIYDLIKYQGAAPVNVSNFSLQLPTRMSATLVNAATTAPEQKLQLNITETSGINWKGNIDTVWDTGTAVGTGGTFNWVSNSIGTNFITGDVVTFDENALAHSVSVNGADVLPTGVNLETFGVNYVFTGTHGIGGSATVLKIGPDKATFANSNSYTGTTTINDGTIEIGNGGTTGSLGSGAVSLTSANSILSIKRSDTVGIANAISGTGTISLDGGGTTSFSGTVAAAKLLVNAGTFTSTGTNMNIPSHVIATGGVIDLAVASGVRDYPNATTYSGTGTLRKTGAGASQRGAAVVTYAMDSGAMIDVQQGKFVAASNANDIWTNNKSDLHVAADAIFDAAEGGSVASGGVFVDALTGTGTIKVGFNDGNPYANKITFGVDNGSATFDGVLADSESADPLAHGSYIKAGTGTQTLTGINTYSGNTTVNDGTLVLSSTSQLRFIIGANGVNNSVGGAGSITLDGGLNIETAAADTTTGNTWTLIQTGTLVETYGSNFTVIGFTQASPGVWEKVVGANKFTFTQSSGILSVAPSSGFNSWAGNNGVTGGYNGDSDNDGIKNLVEYALSLNPAAADGSAGVIAGNTATYTKRTEAVTAADVRYIIETSPDLSIWTPAVTQGPSDPGYADATISHTLPSGQGRLFQRLRVELLP